MAESTITKKALTEAFRELITQIPLSKISVGDICKKCSMNRKSFYYHYKDKYDLANSCFDMDFPHLSDNPKAVKKEFILLGLCRYLYVNKVQYRRLLEIEGQNSFYEHLRSRLRIYFHNRLTDKSNFSAGFWADAVAFAIREWMLAKKSAHYDDFYRQLIACVRIDVELS